MSDNIYVLEESSSEYSTSSEDEEEIIQNTEFMNNTNITEYVNNRNNLFTKDIEMIDVLITGDNDLTNYNDYSISTTNENYKNIIGINIIKGFIITSDPSDKDITNVHVENIPKIACMKNNTNNDILDIIPINTGFGNTAGTTILDKKYFFPIKLDKLRIKFSVINGKALSKFSLVFRLTIINNLNLLK